jgi:Arc/MetJ-type ribon-helix-helix transcriptional regulator
MSNATSDPVLPEGLTQAIDDVIERTGMYESREEFVREACREHLFYILSRQTDQVSDDEARSRNTEDPISKLAAETLSRWEEAEERSATPTEGVRTRSQHRRERLEMSDEEFDRLLGEIESNP